MIHPDIERTILTDHPHREPSTVDCTYCGNEMQTGEEVYAFPSENHYYCSLDCVGNQMLKEGNLERVLLE